MVVVFDSTTIKGTGVLKKEADFFK